MNASQLIAELAARDIRVWANGDRLQIDAPGGALTPELREQLKNAKAEIVELVNGPGPLSFSQERLWVLDQIEPGRATYVIPVALRIRGALNLDALERALTALVARHDSLRTSFREIDGRAVQIVTDALMCPMPVVDIGADDAELVAHLSEEAARGFDLQRDPLFRAVVFRIAPDHHVLLLLQHHIISDAWSVGLLLSELGTLYNDQVKGTTTELGEQSVSYRDFSRWQNLIVDREAQHRQTEYWRNSLSGAPYVLDLPVDHARPPVETHRGSVLSFNVPPDVSANVSALAKREGATLFMVLLAAFETLVWHYTGQHEFLLGTAVAGRSDEHVETLLGLFVNTIVLRADLTARPTVRQLIARVKENALAGFNNEDLPFEKLVDELRPARDLSRNPIFQAMMVLQSAPPKPLQLHGLDVTTVDVDRGASQLDLQLSVQELPTGLRGTFEFATDLFDRSTIERMSGHFATLLRGMTVQPDVAIAEIPLITEAEVEQQKTWNATDVATSSVCLHELITAQVQRTPSEVAVEFAGTTMTYSELDERSSRLCARLRARGVGTGARVGVFMERSLDMVVALLAVLKSGASYIPLDPAFPADRLAFMMEDSAATVLLTHKIVANEVPSRAVPILLVDDDDGAATPVATTNDVRPTLEDLAYVIYTSGSTGKPKGVAISHRAIVNLLESMGREPGFTSRDVMLSVTTLSFDIAALELFLPLIQGGRVCLASRDEALDAEQLVTKIISTGATVMQATPATWRMLIDFGWKGAPHLKVLCGGEALPRDLAESLLKRVGELWDVYGPTETTVWSSAGRVTPGTGSISIGKPIANTQMWVLDDALRPLPAGVPGELYIAGTGLARGYWNRDELTSEKFVDNPFSGDPTARMYRTGDRARWLSDGRLECLGRIDDQVKVRGFRIELGEIEVALRAYSGVTAAVVLAKDGGDGDRRLVAYVTRAPDATVDANALSVHLGHTMPAYMIPSAWAFLPALPLTPNGKVDKRALAQIDADATVDSAERTPPRTRTETQIAEIWGEVLHQESVSIHDNFFMSGGNSLSAVRLMAQLRKAFSVEMGLRTLFERPSIAELATAIDALQTRNHVATGPKAIVPIKSTGTRTPVFAIPGHGGDVFCYVKMAQFIDADQPIYGVQPPGLEDGEPLTSIGELARYAVKQIRATQPSGPYLIAGFCAGGTVAYEIARQIADSGEEVAMLALLGSAYPATYHWGWTTLRAAAYYAGRVRHHWREAFSGASRNPISYLMGIASRTQVQDLSLDSDRTVVHRGENTRRLETATLAGIRAYRAEKFAGRIDMIYPSPEWRKSGAQPQRWRRLARDLRVHVSPTHCTVDQMLLEPFVSATAQVLDNRLREVTREIEKKTDDANVDSAAAPARALQPA